MKEHVRRTAIITGGNKGLGKALALGLAANDFFVIVIARDKELNGRAVSEIEKAGGRAEAYEADLRSPEEVRKAFSGILAKHGRIDVLINNAAVSYFEPAGDIDESKCAEMIDVNLKAVYLACKMALPSMVEKKGGTIINISSIYGVRADKKTSVYSMTKFGLVGYTKGLHADYHEKGIRAKVFCPTMFGEGAVLGADTLCREIVRSVLDPHDRYNEKMILSKKIGSLRMLLFINRIWDRKGNGRSTGYRLKFI